MPYFRLVVRLRAVLRRVETRFAAVRLRVAPLAAAFLALAFLVVLFLEVFFLAALFFVGVFFVAAFLAAVLLPVRRFAAPRGAALFVPFGDAAGRAGDAGLAPLAVRLAAAERDCATFGPSVRTRSTRGAVTGSSPLAREITSDIVDVMPLVMDSRLPATLPIAPPSN